MSPSLRQPIPQEVPDFHTENLVAYFSRYEGSHQMSHSSTPNPDNDDTFGDHVYLSLLNIDSSIPIQCATEPVACSTSMAVARQLMYGQGDCTIIRVLKTDMPAEASRYYTKHDRMMEVSPEYRQMVENGRKNREALKSRRGRKARKASK